MDIPKTLARFIWFFIKKQRKYFIIIQIFSMSWALHNTLWPYAVKLLLDKVIAFDGQQDVWFYLAPVLIFWALLWIVIEAMYRGEGLLMSYVFPKLEADIRMAMFRYATGHSYEFFANNFAGNIASKINDLTRSINEILQLVMSLFIPTFVAVLIAGWMFFSIHYFFALLIMGWAALQMAICLYGSKRCSISSSWHAEARSLLTGKIVDSFTNIINVKLFSKKRHEYRYVGTYQSDERRKHGNAMFKIEQVKIVLGISGLIFPGFLLTWFLIHSWQKGSLGVGDLVLILNTTWNIQMLVWFSGLELPDFFREVGVCRQALSIIRAPHDIKDQPGAKIMQVNFGNIEFRDVSFDYDKGKFLFERVSAKIEAGSKVGLVGYSGSGKSSFAHLIMRFFDIESGKILIDGIDIREVQMDSLRAQISMIPQNPSLFHRTVQENILYGKGSASEAEMLAAAKNSHCHEFIEALPQGYASFVGERGVKLSGGERQRIAIARAILKNAPILILDEATSALDSVTEKSIQSALSYLMEGKTTLVIAHRLSTLSAMDRMLVFKEGKIIEDGSHAELIDRDGHYARMWRMQVGGFLPQSET